MCHGLELLLKKDIQNEYIVMKFIMTVRDIQSSPGEGHAEDERTSDSESATQVIRTRGRPRKYFTDLDAADARRGRARDYYHKKSERMKGQQKLYQHWRREQLNFQRRARHAKKAED